jgi:peptidoglycan/LPS O-acetylase OafA/YrhL
VSNGQRLIKVDGERLGHIPSFDGLRGLFVLLVVGYHSSVTSKFLGTPIVIDWFFVASGFLITTLILDEKNSTGTFSLKNFYSRRVLRLFPAMYAMLGIVLLMLLGLRILAPETFSKGSLWWVEILAAATYCYYLVAAFLPGRIGIIGHTWSLTVEEHFYFIWPLVLNRTLKKATRRNDRNLLVGAVLFIAVMVFLRMRLNHMIEFNPTNVGKFRDEGDVTWEGVVYRIAAVRPDMIVVGCLTAFIARAIPRPVPQQVLRLLTWLAPLSWVLFIAILVGAGRIPGFGLFGGPVYQLALFGLAPITLDLYFRPATPYGRALGVKPLRYLGARSYGIYLWHVPVVLPFLNLIDNSYGVKKLVIGLFVSALGILAGMASFRFVERPFLKMKETRFRRPEEKSADRAAAAEHHATPALELFDGTEPMSDFGLDEGEK